PPVSLADGADLLLGGRTCREDEGARSVVRQVLEPVRRIDAGIGHREERRPQLQLERVTLGENGRRLDEEASAAILLRDRDWNLDTGRRRASTRVGGEPHVLQGGDALGRPRRAAKAR